MPVTRIDLENGHVLKYIIDDPWEVDDLLKLFPADILYRDKAPFKVHTLINAEKVNRVPSGWLRARIAPGLVHPNSGQFVVVGLHGTAYHLMGVLLKTINYRRLVLFNTESEAITYLQQTIKKETGDYADREA